MISPASHVQTHLSLTLPIQTTRLSSISQTVAMQHQENLFNAWRILRLHEIALHSQLTAGRVDPICPVTVNPDHWRSELQSNLVARCHMDPGWEWRLRGRGYF